MDSNQVEYGIVTRQRLSILLAAVVAAGLVLLPREAPTDRIHRIVFDLPLADRYALITRQLDDRESTYLFWSPDAPEATCRRLGTDPSLRPVDGPGDGCSYATGDDVSLVITVEAAGDRGGSLVRVAANTGP